MSCPGGDGSVSHSEFIVWIKTGSPLLSCQSNRLTSGTRSMSTNPSQSSIRGAAANEVYKVILKETGDAMYLGFNFQVCQAFIVGLDSWTGLLGSERSSRGRMAWQDATF